ncbi:MAG: hypothetical protein KC621_00365 [Myxococcales bacterium]|nr:hypothetical protein [Myxococcales bacterium]
MSGGDDWTPSDLLLEELARSLRSTGADFGYTNWFDAVERTVVTTEYDPERGEPVPPEDGAPEWMQGEYALQQQLFEGVDRFHRIDGGEEPGRLHDFIHSVSDDDLRQDLWDAAHRGRGAYRRVRDVLHRRGLEKLWYDYESAADRALALGWLRDEGLLPPEPDDD